MMRRVIFASKKGTNRIPLKGTKKPRNYLTSRIQKDPKPSLFSQHLQCMLPYGFEKLSIKKINLIRGCHQSIIT